IGDADDDFVEPIVVPVAKDRGAHRCAIIAREYELERAGVERVKPPVGRTHHRDHTPIPIERWMKRRRSELTAVNPGSIRLLLRSKELAARENPRLESARVRPRHHSDLDSRGKLPRATHQQRRTSRTSSD